jgi:tRNA (guanine37-N1)-methyltransferase
MNISVATLFPELYRPFFATSLLKRAQEQNKVSLHLTSLLELCTPLERIDSPIAGHGSGMLLKPEIIESVINKQEAQHGKALKIFFSPHGKVLDQDLVKELAQKLQEQSHMMLLPARYEGMDARVEEEYADYIISLGDFVLMGGDIPAMALIEAVLRLVPGVVGKQESVTEDSFSNAFVDHPHYTAPDEWHGKKIPAVLKSGNHQAVDTWRNEAAAKRTVLNHFDWLRSHNPTAEQKKLAYKNLPPHYAVLMHDQVLLQGGVEGTTSVTSIDVHDIARSARTYGLKGYSIVTPLIDQQKIVQTLLDFWQQGVGITYNPSRHEALNQVTCRSSIDEVIAQIEAKEGKRPLLIATSAKESDKTEAKRITYHDQDLVWRHDRPVLFIFGTGHGLSPALIQQCDYLLLPLIGFTSFNHLSVRTATGIIFDRWLGINPKKLYTA